VGNHYLSAQGKSNAATFALSCKKWHEYFIQ